MTKLKIKEEKGITLVALIITIIVLIILAAVTIKIAFDSNFLKIAAEGAENYAKAQEKEEEIMRNLSDFAEGVTNNVTSGNGGGTQETPTLPDGWDKDKVDIYEYGEYDVPIPKGFVVSKADGERSIRNGVVIYQGTEDVIDDNVDEAMTSRNQFVWIPIEDPSEMFGTDKDGNSLGKLYNFGAKNNITNQPTALNWTETDGVMKWTNNTGNREPSIVTGTGSEYDNVASNYTKAGIAGITNAEEFKAQLQSEFELMRQSVEKYHGFYIGRYETGDLSKTKAIVAKGNNDTSNQNWYVQYQKNKTIAEGTSATSSMIWGCQWDAIMKYFLKDSNIAGFVSNADEKGKWRVSKAVTGSSDNYRVKNIYDMAGNVSDWTLEAGSTTYRFGRGGSYDNSDSSHFAAGYENWSTELGRRWMWF